MVSYRYLGSATTDANGIAKYNFTGSGAGEIDYIASLDNPITSSSIVSEIFPVFDYFLYDSGVTGTKNPNVTIGTKVTEQVTSNGTVLTCTNGTSLATAQYTYTKVIGGDFEAYITLTTPSTILMGFYGSNDSARISISNVENRTYKFKRTGSNWIVQYYNGSEWVDLSFYNNTLGNKDCRFYLYLYSDNETDTITFKDVKVTVEDSLNIGGDSIVQSGDTISITGKFYESGVPVKNIDLDIYKNGVKVDTVNTGSTGVASYNYTGLGVGETEFYFKYGSIVSETLSVIDAFYLDNVTSDQTSNYFLNTNNNSLTYNSNGYYILQSNATGTEMYVDLRGKENLIKGQRVRFEADLELNGNTITMAMTGSGITSQSYSTDGICYIEGDVPSTITTTHLRISKTNATSGDNIKIKNIRVYYK